MSVEGADRCATQKSGAQSAPQSFPQPSTLYPPPCCLRSGKRDSNPRPQPWQGCALPTELFPQSVMRLGSRHTGSRSRIAKRPHGECRGTLPSKASTRRPAYSLLPRRGGEGNRTPDLLNAIQALSQLSYAPSSQLSRQKQPKAVARNHQV